MPRRLKEGRREFDTLRRYIRLLARLRIQKLLLALARQPQGVKSLVDSTGISVASVRRSLGRLEAEGLAASTKIGRNKVFRLTDRASVTRRSDKLAIGLQAPDGTRVTVKVKPPKA